MNEETAIVTQSVAIAPIETAENIEVSATLPADMLTAQAQLIEWVTKKISVVKKEARELVEAANHAKKLKYKSSTLVRHAGIAKKRVLYYEKIKSALEHGFYIVPNFPVQLFAIRTDKSVPDRKHSYSYWDSKDQSAKELPEGEGQYQNPFPLVHRNSWTDSEKKSHSESSAYAWDDIEFPITMAKPHIMEATERAMALNIFDQFGVLPESSKRRGDPIIVGQIFHKSGASETSKINTITFMICWHLDTRTL